LSGTPTTTSTTAAILGNVAGLAAVVAHIMGRGSASSGRGAITAEVAQATAGVALFSAVGMRRRSRNGGGGGDRRRGRRSTAFGAAAGDVAGLAAGVANIATHLLLVGALRTDVANFSTVVATL